MKVRNGLAALAVGLGTSSFGATELEVRRFGVFDDWNAFHVQDGDLHLLLRRDSIDSVGSERRTREP